MKEMTLDQIHAIHMQGHNTKNPKLLQQADNLYNEVLTLEPDNWRVLFMLGTLLMEVGKEGIAINLLIRCTQVKENFPEVWNNLGTAYKRRHMNEEAEEALKKALLMKDEARAEYIKNNGGDNLPPSLNYEPDSDTLNNLGTLHINEGTPEQGEPYFRKAIQVSPDHPQAHWNLGLSLLEQGKYEEGFDQYQWGKTTGDRQTRFYGCPEWDGSNNKNIVTYGEQGIGDEIMFASMIPDLQKNNKVIFDCHPRLVNLFKRSFPEVEVHGTRKEAIIDWYQDQKIDAKTSIGDLGRYFRKTHSDFPRRRYLKADPERVKEIRKRLEEAGDGPYIGVHWYGGKHKTRTDLRSIPLSSLTTLVRHNPTFVSLQYTPEADKQVEEFKKDTGLELHHWPEIVRATDYDETAALVSALDLVITVNTSVVHLCGALGVKCWVMTPFGKAWRYFSPDEKKMMWYGDHVRQYMQKEPGNWEPILNRVCKDLRRFIEAYKSKRAA